MKAAFLYYVFCSTVNRVASRMKRLRQPKYLASALGGAAYFYYFLFRHAGSARPGGSFSAGAGNAAALPLLQTGFALLLLALVLLPWIVPVPGKGLQFSEAEVQFLFPAPVSRRSVINFRILRMQTGIVFGVLVFAVLFSRNLGSARFEFLVVTLWIVYSFLALYRMGASLAKLSLMQRGVSPFFLAALTLAFVAVSVVLAVVQLQNAPPLMVEEGRDAFVHLSDWIATNTRTGPVYYLLLPSRALIGPAFATDLSSFLGRLPSAVLILVLAYFWVIRGDVKFEEVAAEEARKTAAEARQGRRVSPKPRTIFGRPREAFSLGPTGDPSMAILWKNLVAAGSFGVRKVLSVGAAIVAVAIVTSLRRTGAPAGVLSVAGFAAAGIAAMLGVMGPVMIRDDLRVDLLHAEQLKSWPVPGWRIVLGEVLAPSVILAAGQWVLIIIAVVLWPSRGSDAVGLTDRVLYGSAAALLLPALSLAGVVTQNGFTLLMPGWVQLGKDERRGIEASGQRLITMVGSLFVLAVVALPAGVVFALVYISGSWLIGLFAVPVAAVSAAVVIAGEMVVVVFFLGRVFDRLDISLEKLSES